MCFIRCLHADVCKMCPHLLKDIFFMVMLKQANISGKDQCSNGIISFLCVFLAKLQTGVNEFKRGHYIIINSASSYFLPLSDIRLNTYM